MKNKVSRFEYAIAKVASEINNDPSIIVNIEPKTEAEEFAEREEKLKGQILKFRTKLK